MRWVLLVLTYRFPAPLIAGEVAVVKQVPSKRLARASLTGTGTLIGDSSFHRSKWIDRGVISCHKLDLHENFIEYHLPL